jgi:signal transduction histidine kinase
VHTALAREELEPGGDPTEARAHLDVVTGEIHRVGALVESYLQFGRPPHLWRTRVDLEDFIDARLAALEKDLRARRISVQHARSDVPPVIADTGQLGQVLDNLVKNAIEAMPPGGTLTVATAWSDRVVTIDVADTGPGVRPEDAERIFLPFHSTKPLGAGLGLAVAREIMQEHGGSLTCRAGAGGGCFVMTLPLRCAPEARP